MRATSWHTSPLPYATIRELSKSLNASEVFAAVLARRGYHEPEAAARFLSPAGELYDPFLLPQMEAACRRVETAIARRERICIHGDYDVDGITATALLLNILRQRGAVAGYHLPNRFSEGYGIYAGAIEKIAAEGTSLLVTVDCGISAREPLARAAALGMDVIVIDHHRPVAATQPDATIISPRLGDYPFKELAGVGLAFKFAQALLAGETEEPGDIHPLLQQQLDLVALGTIADVVPLVDENRSLVKRGLTQLSRTRRPGLVALMAVAQMDQSHVNAGLVAFRLAPRINAAGRLDDPEPALKLLLTENDVEGRELAGQLDSLNRERQQIENRMLAEAEKLVSQMPAKQKEKRGWCLSSPGWHEGVIGIVASRMVELHYRPVFMIAEGESHGKGSGRSIPAFDLHASLVDLSHLFEAFGGHKSACGLTIANDRIEEFQHAFADYADARLAGEDQHPSRYVDALVGGRELTLELAEELAQLEPFGLGNPSVDLLASGVRIHNGRTTRNGLHFQCLIEAGGARSSAIGFRQAYLAEKLDAASQWDVAFRLEPNEFNGSVSAQLNLREVFPRPRKPEPPRGLCESHCDFDCPERIRGDEFWSLCCGETPLRDPLLDLMPGVPPEETDGDSGSSDRLIDRRDFGGIPAQVAKLMSTGENVLLLVADLARRRNQLVTQLPVASSGIGQVLLAGSRCGGSILKERLVSLKQDSPALMLADFATAVASPDLVGSFDHLVFIDPPLNRNVFDFLAAAAPEAYLHLFHCSNEVQFTKEVVEHEFNLRAPVTRVYKHLKAGNKYPLDDTTERLLLAGGKHLRQPAMVAKCLKVLEELSLVAIEKVEERPILALLEPGKTRLDKSPTYKRSRIFYKECLKYLNTSLSTKVN